MTLTSAELCYLKCVACNEPLLFIQSQGCAWGADQCPFPTIDNKKEASHEG